MGNIVRGWFILVLLCSSGTALAQQGEATWLVLDVPPSMILDGPFAGQGNIDKILQTFVLELPEYNHRTEGSNIERLSRELQGTGQIASPGLLLTPERERQFAVSIPEAIVPSNMVIVRRDRLSEFRKFQTSDGDIDLKQLLDSPLRVGVALGRRYSGPVDALLAEAKEQPNLLSRSASDVSEGLVKMLSTDRIDCCLLFPFEAQFVARQQGSVTELTSLPISGMAKYSVTVAVAPKTLWGETLIRKLNVVIRAYRASTFLEAMTPWLDRETIPLYRQWALDFFATNP